jgi:hypothetical protein
MRKSAMAETASKVALSEVPKSSAMTEDSLQGLKDYFRLAEESETSARLLEKTERYRDMVPPHILEQVREDYRKKKEETDAKLERQKEGFQEPYHGLMSEKELLETDSQNLRDRLKELRFRIVVGEITEENARDGIRDMRRQLSAIVERLDQIEEILDLYVMIGLDDLRGRADSVEIDDVSSEEESSYGEAFDQEQEPPLPKLNELDMIASYFKDEQERGGGSDQGIETPESATSKEDAAESETKTSSFTQGYLTILDGSRKGDCVPLIPGDVTLGSSPNTDVMLTDQGISESHARIFYKDCKYYFENLDASGRSYVNGIQSSTVQLNHNDVLRLGDLSLRVDLTTIDL